MLAVILFRLFKLFFFEFLLLFVASWFSGEVEGLEIYCCRVYGFPFSWGISHSRFLEVRSRSSLELISFWRFSWVTPLFAFRFSLPLLSVELKLFELNYLLCWVGFDFKESIWRHSSCLETLVESRLIHFFSTFFSFSFSSWERKGVCLCNWLSFYSRNKGRSL